MRTKMRRQVGSTILFVLIALGVMPSARQSPAYVWYGTSTPVAIPDAASVDSLVFVDGLGSAILDVRVSLHIIHPAASDLDVSLVGPDGTVVDLTSDNGGTGANYGAGCTSEADRTRFDDAGAVTITGSAAPFVGTFRPEQALGAFAGKAGPGAANGVWRLRLADDTVGATGTLQCWTLFVAAAITAPVSLDDAYIAVSGTPLVVAAPGVLTNDTSNGGGAMTAAVVSAPTHGFLDFAATGGFTYTPSQGFFGADRFAYRATNTIGTGNPAWVNLTVTVPSPTAVNDVYALSFETPLVVAAPGVLANDVNPASGSSMTAGLVTSVSHGALSFTASGAFSYVPAAGYAGSDTFTYRAINTGGAGNVATVSLHVGAPTTVQPPAGLVVHRVSGHLVTLRWTPPALGPPPSEYLLEGGLAPGQVLASVPTGSSFPIYSFTAPSGAFYVRMYALGNGGRSAASNERRLYVEVPVAPSPPAGVVSVVNGSAVSLAWRNTYDGGAPTQIALEVSGTLAGVIPLGAVDTFGAVGVPPGSYSLRVWAANAAGVGAPAAPVVVSVPGTCPGVPAPPADFLAYRLGRTISVVWDPPASGPAPTAYVLSVTGAFVGRLTTPQRSLSGLVGPGSYTLSVAGINACGTGAAAAAQTLVVP